MSLDKAMICDASTMMDNPRHLLVITNNMTRLCLRIDKSLSKANLVPKASSGVSKLQFARQESSSENVSVSYV